MRLVLHYCCAYEVYWLTGLTILAYMEFSDTEPQLVEDAVKYIIFLVDADRLFDTALGMYDFSLVLMIAQHAQKVGTLLFNVFTVLNTVHPM